MAWHRPGRFSGIRLIPVTVVWNNEAVAPMRPGGRSGQKNQRWGRINRGVENDRRRQEPAAAPSPSPAAIPAAPAPAAVTAAPPAVTAAPAAIAAAPPAIPPAVTAAPPGMGRGRHRQWNEQCTSRQDRQKRKPQPMAHRSTPCEFLSSSPTILATAWPAQPVDNTAATVPAFLPTTRGPATCPRYKGACPARARPFYPIRRAR